jgi:hypothetical protein
VAAAAEGGVEVHAARLDVERRQNFAKQYRPVIPPKVLHVERRGYRERD